MNLIETERDEARRALKDVVRMRERSNAFHAYARSGTAVAVWGGVWLFANLVSYFAPAFSGAAWILGIIVGMSTGIAGGMKAASTGRTEEQTRLLIRSVAASGIIAAMIAGLFMVLGVPDATSANAAISLIVAGAYCLSGLWNGARFFWLGLVVAAAIAVGWVWLHEVFALWMGVVGGGVLILTGLWLRRA